VRIIDTPAYREWLRIHDELLVAYRALNIAAIRDLGWQARAVMSEEEFLKIVDCVEEILGDSIGLSDPVDEFLVKEEIPCACCFRYPSECTCKDEPADEDALRDQTMPYGWDFIDTSIPEDETPW